MVTYCYQQEILEQEHCHKKNSYLGKIILINKLNKDLGLFSVGHRNPQGLLYDKENDIILSTEHGPWGGDEINIIYNNKITDGLFLHTVNTIVKKQPLDDECIKKYKDFPSIKVILIMDILSQLNILKNL